MTDQDQNQPDTKLDNQPKNQAEELATASNDTNASDTTSPVNNTNGENGDTLVGTTTDSAYGKIKHISIVSEMEKSYLDYAMSVIVQRALPDVRDGLKPVHRRILFSMYKSGIHHNTSYKKSARIVGDVLGKYHPHGDAPVYMALVRLAQLFSMRYPLIDGQGNFGSIDGDSPAAMRYTEARLAKISRELLADINKNTVKFADNFDGSMQEPLVLPTRLPNLLLAGSEGIAVGMATKIPPHNLNEVCKAIIDMIKQGEAVSDFDATAATAQVKAANQNKATQANVPELIKTGGQTTKVDQKTKASDSKADLKNKTKKDLYDPFLAQALVETDSAKLAGQFNSEITFDTIMTHIQGPDFPTAGIIYDFKTIKQGYETGKGKVVIRAKASIEEDKKGRFQIIVTQLPYQVNKARLLEKIAKLVRDKRLVGIRNLRDDSDRIGLQITIELKRDARPKVVLNKLFKYTSLQTSFPMNMVALNSEGTPQLMNIRQILKEYIVHRQLVITRRSQYELQEARNRAHILEGLLIALANLDDVIETIRRSADTETAHKALMKKFGLSDPQATAILDMQLKRLAALERQKIEDEYKSIKELISQLIILLTKPDKILEVVTDETEEMIQLYGDERRTKLVKSKIGEFNEEDLVANENAVITLTKSGYIKRLSPSSFRSQSRGGKGSIGMSMKDEDVILFMFSAQTHDTLLYFTNQGRVFKLKAFEVPESRRQAKGTAIVNLLNLKAGEKVQSILTVDQEKNQSKFITLATRNGLVKKTAVKLFDNIRQNGIVAITLNKGDELVWGKITSGQDHIMLISYQGKSIRFSEKEVKASQRDTKGVKGITLRGEDYVVGVESFPKELEENKKAAILIVAQNGLGKRTQLKQYPLQKRSGLGVKVADITEKTGNVASARLVTEEHKEIVISTKNGQTIKLPLKRTSVPFLTRPTQGVILMKLKKTDKVVAVALTSEIAEKNEK